MSEIRPKNVLVVDDDEVLAQVVGRVLSQQGFTVRHAATVRRALEMARANPPDLALLDLCLPDGNGVELASSLRRRQGGLPLLLMTAYPLREQEKPVLAEIGARLLAKPFSPAGLREAVSEALATPAPPKNNPAIIPSITSGVPSFRGPTAGPASGTGQIGRESMPRNVKESVMRVFLVKFSKRASVVVLILVLLVGLAMVAGIVRAPWLRAAEEKPLPTKTAALAVELVPNMPHTLKVPQEVRETLGFRKGGRDIIHVVQRPKHGKELVLPGSTLFDPTRLYRVRARFAPSPSSARCTKIEEITEDPNISGKPGTTYREIRSGDRVKKDHPLAVFESVDVGSKKNDLVDALVQLKLDQDVLNRAYKAAGSGALAEVFLLTARKNVEADKNAVARAENTLRTWDIPDEDINKVKEEAKRINEQEGQRDEESKRKAREDWPKVVLRAPADGVIVERNLALNEIVADNTTNLFQIAQVERLAIVAYCPEDDLPTLYALPTADRRWTVRTVGSAPIQGFISDISYLIDPNQHTAVVKGYIDNPGEAVRAGQFISATIELPPPDDVVEVPADAVMEDGQQAIVFVQTDPAKHYCTMRRVKPEARFDKTLWIRSKPFAKGEERSAQEEELGILPKEPLRPGERILQTAVGELKVALMDKESQPGKK